MPVSYCDPIIFPSSDNNNDIHIDIYLPSKSHGALIGERGIIINRLQTQYNCRIQIPSKSDLLSSKIILHGSLIAIKNIIIEIEQLTGYRINGNPLLNAGIIVTKGAHGSLIGTGGTILKLLQKEFNCFINIPKREDPSDIINVQGSKSGIMALVAKMENLLKQSVTIKWEGGEGGGERGGNNNYSSSVSSLLSSLSLNDKKNKLKLDINKDINEVLFFPDDRAISTSDKAGQGSAAATNFDRFLLYLQSATKTIDVCVFTITDDRISRILEDLYSEGVKIRIITEASTIDDKGSDIRSMAKIGMPIKMDTNEALMHHKFAVIDNKLVVNGSFNWTRAASMVNQENVVISSHPPFIKSFSAQFNKLWNDNDMKIVNPDKSKDDVSIIKKSIHSDY